MNKPDIQVGDAVRVTPTNPLAVGRGTGIIVKTGDTICLVKFPQWERPIACFVADTAAVKGETK